MIGFKLAKPGFSATEASVADTYVNTDAPILKVAQRGNGSITFNVGETNTSKDLKIPYNLSYKPLVQAFAERKPLGNMCLVQSIVQRASTDVIAVISLVDDKNLVLRFTSSLTDPAGVYRYLYYIFYDEAIDD